MSLLNLVLMNLKYLTNYETSNELNVFIRDVKNVYKKLIQCAIYMESAGVYEEFRRLLDVPNLKVAR